MAVLGRAPAGADQARIGEIAAAQAAVRRAYDAA